MFAVAQADFLRRLWDALDDAEQVVLVGVGGVAAEGTYAGANVYAFAVELSPAAAQAVALDREAGQARL